MIKKSLLDIKKICVKLCKVNKCKLNLVRKNQGNKKYFYL